MKWDLRSCRAAACRPTGSGPWHLDLRERLADQARRLGLTDVTPIRLVLGPRPRILLQSPRLPGRGRADGGLSRACRRSRLTPTRGRASNI